MRHFTIQNAWTWEVIDCPHHEALVWAMINESCGGFAYNIYEWGGNAHHLTHDDLMRMA